MSDPIRVIPATPFYGVGKTPGEAIAEALAARDSVRQYHGDAHGVMAEQPMVDVAPEAERGPDDA